MLIIPVGIPGCGKSSLGSRLADLGAFPRIGIVSRDAYREILTGDMSNQAINDECYAITNKIAETRLRYKQDVYLDATNLVFSWYERIHKVALEEKHSIIYLPFHGPDQAFERNAKRVNPVPDSVMQKMLARWQQVDFTGVNNVIPIWEEWHAKQDVNLAWKLRTYKTTENATWELLGT